jgi:hypothetical protein
VEVQTSEVDAIPAPVSLAQQWVKFGKLRWTTQECTVLKQWVSLLSNNETGRSLKALLEDMVWYGISARLA